jgi:hypothetical protein
MIEEALASLDWAPSGSKYILVSDNSDGRRLPYIGPFSSLAAASDWRSDAERQGVIYANRYHLRALQEPQPLEESPALTNSAVTDLLDYTDIGNGYHTWLTEDGPVTVTREELRRAFDNAYDPNEPDWAMRVKIDDIDVALRLLP